MGGMAQFSKGDYKGAIKSFDKATELDPRDAEAYINRGWTKAKLGQHFAAIIDYDKVLELDPDYALAYVGRGIAQYQRDHPLEAEQDILTAYQLAEQVSDTNLKAFIVKTALDFGFQLP